MHTQRHGPNPPTLLAIVTIAAAAWACGGGGDAASEAGVEPTPAPAASAAASGEVDPAWAGSVDEALAASGEELFTTKGCVACHQWGNRLVGPDLTGITTRRSRDWVSLMITKPDSMIREDPAARELFAEYMTPMSDQRVTEQELDALLEYLKRDGGE